MQNKQGEYAFGYKCVNVGILYNKTTSMQLREDVNQDKYRLMLTAAREEKNLVAYPYDFFHKGIRDTVIVNREGSWTAWR